MFEAWVPGLSGVLITLKALLAFFPYSCPSEPPCHAISTVTLHPCSLYSMQSPKKKGEHFQSSLGRFRKDCEE